MITESQLFGILSKCPGVKVNIEVLQAAVPLHEQGLDSLDISMFIFELENKLAISIPTSKIGDLRSMADFVSYLNTLTQVESVE